MNRGQDELERFQNVITESLQRFLSQPTPEGQVVTSHQERTKTLLESLQAITEEDLVKLGHKGISLSTMQPTNPLTSPVNIDSTCSICIQPFLAILAEEESASVMESPALFSGELGVTRLNQPWQCGHLFCRRDITKWIKTGKLTCPMCRKSLVEPGSEPEPEPWQDSDLGTEGHPVHDMFAIGGNADLERFLFGHTGTNSGQQDTRRRSNSESNNGRHDYSGMYS